MNESGGISAGGAGGGKALVVFSHGVKKTARSNSLTQNGQGGDRAGKGFGAGSGGEKPYRSGTVAAVSNRDAGQHHAIALVATFVAQVLGQVLPDPGRGLDRQTAYRPAPGRSAVLFDASL